MTPVEHSYEILWWFNVRFFLKKCHILTSFLSHKMLIWGELYQQIMQSILLKTVFLEVFDHDLSKMSLKD